MVVVNAVTGGTVSLVQGSYEYFHYLHDGYNDSVISILLLTNGCNMFIKLHLIFFILCSIEITHNRQTSVVVAEWFKIN